MSEELKEALEEQVAENAEINEEAPVAEEISEESAENVEAAAEATDDDASAGEASHADDGKYEVEGILELAEDGFGFLRFDNFLTSNKDIYVSPTQIRRFGLRTGDKINGIARKPRGSERFGALLFVKDVDGLDPMTAKRRPHFDNLTPIFADEKIVLENSSIDLSTRVMDLVAPIGRGQRGIFLARGILSCYTPLNGLRRRLTAGLAKAGRLKGS